MLYKKESFPKKDELVICTVKRVLPLSAFVSLEEYQEKEGLLHISEIAHRVKKIKDFIKVGQTIVCIVLRVNEKKGDIDVSLKRVKNFEEKKKFNEWKKVNRIENLLKKAIKSLNLKDNDIIQIEKQIIIKYENLSSFFDFYQEEKEKTLEDINMPKQLKENFLVLLKDLDKKKEYTIKLNISLSSYEGDGVSPIKKLLDFLKKKIEELGVKVSITYLGSSKYFVRIVTKDVKKVGKALREIVEEIEKTAKKENIIFLCSMKK